MCECRTGIRKWIGTILNAFKVFLIFVKKPEVCITSGWSQSNVGPLRYSVRLISYAPVLLQKES